MPGTGGKPFAKVQCQAVIPTISTVHDPDPAFPCRGLKRQCGLIDRLLHRYDGGFEAERMFIGFSTGIEVN
uniref:Uncharacterized protein n=1 Tax=Physcomitrium patens TaxID=3218 RepID=A0A2K1KPK7_PHYPA|nr:hypothetical protein PHYPA_006573 [Physcomitrium patens]